MKRRTLAVLLTLAAAPWASAQLTVSQTAVNPAWLNLQSLMAPAPPPESSNPADISAALVAQQNQLEQASQAAKTFYTSYPSDPQVAAARKLEVVLALESVQSGNTAYEAHATDLAESYLSSPANSVGDRFDVSLDLSVLSPDIRKSGLIGGGSAYWAMGDSLYAQYGAAPQVYAFYVNVLHTADPVTAAAGAQKLLTMNSPAWAKAEANRILSRTALVGVPLDLSITTSENKTLQLGAVGSTPTLIYVWSNRLGTKDLDLLAKYKSLIPSGTRIVYLSLQSNSENISSAENDAPLPGIFCFDPIGLEGINGRTLGVTQTPYVYVLDKQGNVTAFGPLEQLSALLSSING